MKWMKINIVNILVIIVSILLIYKTLFNGYYTDHVSYIYIIFLSFLGILMYVFYGIILKTRKHKLVFIVILITSILLIFLLFRNSLGTNLINKFIENITNIYDDIKSNKRTSFKDFMLLISIITPIISATLIYFNDLGLKNFISVFTSIFFIVFYNMGHTNTIELNIKYLIIIIIFNLVYNDMIREIGRKESFDTKKFNTAIMYIIIIAFIISFASLKIETIDIKTRVKLNEIIKGENIDKILNKSIESEYSLKSSGYKNTESKLGGSVNIDKSLVMTIEANSSEYLRGNVKDLYSGKTWNRSSETFKEGTSYKNLPNIKFLQDKNVELSKMKITVKNINSTTIFSHLFTNKVNTDSNVILYSVQNNTLISEFDARGTYTVEYYDYNITKEDYKENKNKEKYNNYLQIPTSVTEDTVNLVNEITKDAKDNYTKATLIKEYLQTNFEYSLETDEIKSNDFVHDFLFNSKKGYCVYFASAMTIMCRIAGIEARYVEGFKMPSKSTDDIYYVTNENAHAWSEILVSGEDNVWQIFDASKTVEELNKEESVIESQSTENAEEIKTPENIDNENNNKINNEKQKKTDKKNEGNILLYVITILLLSLFSRIVYLINRYSIIKNSTNPQKIYKYINKRFRSIGKKNMTSKTEKEELFFIEEYELKSKINSLIDVLYEIKFGNNENLEYYDDTIIQDTEKYIKSKSNILIYYLKLVFRF